MASSTEKTQTYDAVIIGTGQAGKPLARGLAEAGWKTAIVERLHVGGTCVNVGCTPTKTMVASARVAYLARRAAEYGVDAGPVKVDLREVIRRKRKVVESFRNGSRRSLESTEGVDLIMGEAAFESPNAVGVRLNGGGMRRLTAEHIFINTGTRSAVPPIEGLKDTPTLDNASIMELESLPEHLLVLGGGYIGLEFGQMFHRFGSKVTIVQRSERVLGREDPDVAEAVADILRKEGIQILLNTSSLSAARGADGSIELTVQTAGKKKTLKGSHLLVAAGRAPNTDRLDLETAGVRTDRGGYVQVNDKLETSAPGVYALGDVKGGPAFTHISYDDYRIVYTNLVEKGNAGTRDRLVPYTVFIDPQLGRVGLTETEARARGLEFRVARLPMEHVARAIESSETRGFMKAVVDPKSEQILGCAVLGMEGGEIMSVLQVAMMGRLPYTAIQEGIFAHPTLAESLNNLFLTLEE